MAESCNFNCSAPQVPYLPDSDISGAGVVVNYVATAALAVLIIFVYYVTIHDPSIDPFNTTRGGALSDRHNPLDDLLLRCLRSGPAYISKHVLGSRQILSPRAWSQLERVLIKCLLLMSDLQIVTGFAILLSGFTQFQCGLAALNWRIILDLAWFSCLTHLSCLTMLRRHLYTHTFERAWRLFAMGVLAVLLAVGLLLTANPKWLLLTEDTRATPAVCILGCYLKPGPNKKWVEIIPEEELWNSLEWFWTPIISAIFIVVAFFSRVVRLHMALSVGVNRATQRLNGQMQRLLWVLFRVLCTEGDIYSLKRSLGYRPVFAIVMVLRFVLVSWASFAVEVSWVLTAFLWGTWRLIKDLSPDQNMEALDFSKQAWTFGQIVSVFALAAPLISIVGILEENSNEEIVVPRQLSESQQCSGLPVGSIRSGASQDLERPDTGWAAHSSCLGTASVYVYASYIYICFVVFLFWEDGLAPLNSIAFGRLGILIPAAIICLYFVVLGSLSIEVAVPHDRCWLRRLLQLLLVGFFISVNTFWGGLVTQQQSQLVFAAGIGLYIIGALIHRAIGWSKR